MNIKWTDKDYKRRTMENHQTEANRNSDKKKKMELDWTHLRKEAGAIEKTALDWNPQGCRRRGRPKKRGEGQ
jgi:hypothetical protein